MLKILGYWEWNKSMKGNGAERETGEDQKAWILLGIGRRVRQWWYSECARKRECWNLIASETETEETIAMTRRVKKRRDEKKAEIPLRIYRRSKSKCNGDMSRQAEWKKEGEKGEARIPLRIRPKRNKRVHHQHAESLRETEEKKRPNSNLKRKRKKKRKTRKRNKYKRKKERKKKKRRTIEYLAGKNSHRKSVPRQQRTEITNSRTVAWSGVDLWQIREFGLATHVSSGITRRVPIMNTYKEEGRSSPRVETGDGEGESEREAQSVRSRRLIWNVKTRLSFLSSSSSSLWPRIFH